MGSEQGTQLELFELADKTAPRPYHREALGRVLLQLRYDQLILGAMGTIVGLTVVFASGVERGKQLARGERSMLARQEPITLSEPPALPPEPELPLAAGTADTVAAAASAVVSPQPPAPVPAAKPAPKSATTETPAPAEKKKKEPVKAKTGKSRYAVQVVTFSRPQQAKAEMERLRATGEPAFLVIRDGGPSVVYVGPFPSKDNAAQKVGNLKAKYRDCFVKSL